MDLNGNSATRHLINDREHAFLSLSTDSMLCFFTHPKQYTENQPQLPTTCSRSVAVGTWHKLWVSSFKITFIAHKLPSHLQSIEQHLFGPLGKACSNT